MTLPRRRTRTPVLAFALLAGLLTMHGLTGTASADMTRPAAHAAVMDRDMTHMHAGTDSQAAIPTAPSPHGPHHRPAATGHHPCLAAPVDAAITLHAPASTAAPDPPLPQAAAEATTHPRARADRAPPDLSALCVSRT